MISIKLEKLKDLYYNLFIIIIKYILVFSEKDINLIILYILLVGKEEVKFIKKKFLLDIFFR